MFQFNPINPNIQKKLFKRIDALNRENTYKFEPLTPITSLKENAIDAILTKSCWANVVSAVYDTDKDGNVNNEKLLRISSAIGKDKQPMNSPITSTDSLITSDAENIHRAHSGITSITTSFKNHSIQNITINWKFWNIKEFEKYKQAFLKHGRMVMVEFGWGSKEELTLSGDIVKGAEDMLTVYKATQRQILGAGGDYYCAMGQIKNYNYKINQNGGFDCTTELTSMGNTLFKGSIEPHPDTKVPEIITSNNSDEKAEAFNHSNFYFEHYLKGLDNFIKHDFKAGVKGVYHNGEKGWCNWAWFEDIVLNTFFAFTTEMGGEADEPLKTKIRSRDIHYKTDENSKIIDERNHNTWCRNSDALWSNTIDILFPGQIPGILTETELDNFRNLPDGGEKINPIIEFMEDLTEINKMRKFGTDVKIVHPDKGPQGEVIKENSDGVWFYNPTDAPNTAVIVPAPEVTEKKGIIRNIVFSADFLKNAFSGGVTDLGSALESFWSSVSSQYGEYWDFDVVSSQNNNGHIGIVDRYSVTKRVKDVNPDGVFADPSTRTNPNGTFVFSNYGRNSLCKEFDLDVKLTAAQATMAVFHSNKNPNRKAGGSGKVENLGIKALAELQNIQIMVDETATEEEIKEKYRDKLIDKITFPFLENQWMRYGKPPDGYEGALQDVDLKLETVPTTIKDNISEFDVKEASEKVQAGEQWIKENDGGVMYWKFKDDDINASGMVWQSDLSQLYPPYNRYMLYLLNNTKEAQKEVDPLVPLTVNFTIPGIAGIQMYDIFAIDYLPEDYKKYCVFQVNGLDHSIDSTGWSTTISGQMRIDMDLLTDQRGEKLDENISEFLLEWDGDRGQDLDQHKKIVKDQKDKIGSNSANPDGDQTDDGTESEANKEIWQKSRNTDINIEKYGDQLYEAMDGGGTTEWKIEDAYTALHEFDPGENWVVLDETKLKIKEYFNKKYAYINFNMFTKDEYWDLQAWLANDANDDTEKKYWWELMGGAVLPFTKDGLAEDGSHSGDGYRGPRYKTPGVLQGSD